MKNKIIEIVKAPFVGAGIILLMVVAIIISIPIVFLSLMFWKEDDHSGHL